MEVREDLLFETLKHDLSASLVVLDNESNVVFINDRALEFLVEQKIEAKEFCDRLLNKEQNGESLERQELEMNEKIIGYSLKKVFENCNLNRIVVIFKDITEIKKYESEKKAKMAMQELGELALYIAHEIKNSLNLIKGFSQLMIESDDINFIKAHLEYLLNETERLNKLTHNILDYTKGEGLILETINIVDYLKELIELYYGNEKISFMTENDVVLANVDKDKIKQVFMNIIQNGIEAIDENDGIFNIYIEQNENIDIIFETNKEIEADFQIDKVFSPYYTTKKNGNGLGLAICKKIVKEHHAEINVTKNFYNGLTFTISLSK